MSKYCKSVADSLMEPATSSCLEIELRGRSKSEQSRVEIIHSQIPAMYMASNSSTQQQKIWCPNIPECAQSNPFPYKSLKIAGVDQSRTFLPSEFSQIPVLKLVSGWDFGHNLHSLILCKGFQISPYMLKLLLQKMPNLKVLQISDSFLVVDDDDVGLDKDRFKLPPLSQLTVLKLYNNREIGSTLMSSYHKNGVNVWVLNSYVGSPTLAQLELYDDGSNLCVTLENFPNLKALKLWWLKNKNIFTNSECLPLEQLSINYVNGFNITFEIFTGFLNKFAHTLVHLEIIDVHLGDKGDLKPDGFDYRKEITCNFPNLKFFSWNYPRDQEAMEALAFYFLPRFPALKKLELTEFSREDPSGVKRVENHAVPLPLRDVKEIMDLLERENYWAVCRKLESIYVFRRFETQNAVYVGYRKEKDEAEAAN